VGIFTTISGFFGGIVSFVLIIILSFYLSVQEDGVGDFLRIIVPIRYESYVINLWQRSAEKIGLWMQGQILLGVLIGVLTYLGLSILGVRNALFLALIAAIFELIPVFGVILSTIPALAIALTDGGISLALLTLGLYVIIQQFESNLIYPLVVKKIVGIPSILVILTLIIGAKLAGFLGIILSVPAAAIITEVLNDIEKRKMKERI
jgi:predicted PurR-regulated permease PerM